MGPKVPTRFNAYVRRAQALVDQPGRVQALLGRAVTKLARSGGDKFAQLRAQVALAVELLRAWLAGDYRAISVQTVVVLLGGVLYFVVPMDVVPDFLLGWGFVDDAAVLSYVFHQLDSELSAFKQWQAEQAQSEETPAPNE